MVESRSGYLDLGCGLTARRCLASNATPKPLRPFVLSTVTSTGTTGRCALRPPRQAAVLNAVKGRLALSGEAAVLGYYTSLSTFRGRRAPGRRFPASPAADWRAGT